MGEKLKQELLQAFKSNDRNTVDDLLPRGIARIQDEFSGGTLLHYAAQNGWADVCRLLVEQYQVDPRSATWKNGLTPLHLAANRDVCRLLVEEYGVNPNVQSSDGSTALHCACVGSRLGVVDYLVHLNGCNVKATNNNGNTPLDCCPEGNNATRTFMVQYLDDLALFNMKND